MIFSYPMFKDLERGQTSLTGLAAHRITGAGLAFRGKSLNGLGIGASGGYFGVLGFTPTLGRLLGPDDDRAVGGSPVAVLSHRFWTTELGADPSVLNQTILINGTTMTIVGVAPPGGGSDGLGGGSLNAAKTPEAQQGCLRLSAGNIEPVAGGAHLRVLPPEPVGVETGAVGVEPPPGDR